MEVRHLEENEQFGVSSSSPAAAVAGSSVLHRFAMLDTASLAGLKRSLRTELGVHGDVLLYSVYTRGGNGPAKEARRRELDLRWAVHRKRIVQPNIDFVCVCVFVGAVAEAA